jgi:hypothetical protein
MPYKYAVEMLCDSLAAGQTYAKNESKDFTYTDELKYFINKFDNGCAMHSADQKFIYLVLRNLKNLDNVNHKNNKVIMKFILRDKFLSKDILHDLYDYSATLSDEDFKVIRESLEKELFRKKEDKDELRESTNNAE